jgi:tetratricopeptide (TPR) repeat protein
MKKLLMMIFILLMCISAAGQYGDAFIFGERILSMTQKSIDTKDRDIVLKSVAFLYAQTKREDEGVAALRMIKNESEFIPAVMTFARILSDKSNFKKAVEVTALLKNEYRVEMLIDISESMINSGRVNECRDVLNTAEREILESFDPYRRTKFYSLLSSNHYRIKNTPKALELISKALWTAQSIKDSDKKAFALKDVSLAYLSMNNRIISMFVENQINSAKNPMTLMEISLHYIEAGEKEGAKKFLNTAKKRAEKEKNMKLKAKMLYEAAYIYAKLGMTKSSEECAQISLSSAKMIQSRSDRINAIITANNIFQKDDVYASALQEIPLISDYSERVSMMIDISSGYMSMGMKEKSFFLLKVILGELKKNKQLLNMENVLERVSDIYIDYGSSRECMDFISFVKRDFSEYPLIISKMYYANGNCSDAVKYSDKSKDWKKRSIQKIKITELAFNSFDKGLSQDMLEIMLKEISNSNDALYKSIFLSEVALLCVKYEIPLEKRTLSLLEKI